jgi:hypothetical protein
MSATTFTILPESLAVGGFTIRGVFGKTHQELSYVVREVNGSEFKVAILFNTRSRAGFRYPQTVDKSVMLGQATLREKQHHGIRLSAVELNSLRYANLSTPKLRIRSRVLIKKPTPAPAPRPAAPVATPAQLAATNTALQTQITRLTSDVANLRAQLQRETADKTRLTEQLAATQRQPDTLTASFRQLLTQ